MYRSCGFSHCTPALNQSPFSVVETVSRDSSQTTLVPHSSGACSVQQTECALSQDSRRGKAERRLRGRKQSKLGAWNTICKGWRSVTLKHSSCCRQQGSLDKWLIQGQGQEACKKNLEHFATLEGETKNNTPLISHCWRVEKQFTAWLRGIGLSFQNEDVEARGLWTWGQSG